MRDFDINAIDEFYGIAEHASPSGKRDRGEFQCVIMRYLEFYHNGVNDTIASGRPPPSKRLRMSSQLNHDITENVKQGIWTRLPVKGKSIEARYFDEIMNGADPVGFKICKICDQVYSSNSIPNCRKHAEERHMIEQITAKDVEKWATMMALEDCRPFKIVEDFGFLNFVQKMGDYAIALYKSGKKYDAKSVLPREATISKNVDYMLGETKNAILPKIIANIKKSGCSLTLDFKQENIDYFILTAHLIDDKWQLKSFILSFAKFDSLLEKSADNIYAEFLSVMGKYGFMEAEASHFAVTTGEGSGAKVAFNAREKYIKCSCHILNTCAKHAVTPYVSSDLSTTAKRKLKSLKTKLTSLISFIASARQIASLQATLNIGLCASMETRWLSDLLIIDVFIKNVDEICKNIDEFAPESIETLSHLMLDLNTFSIFRDFMNVFRKPILDLQQENQVTISLVIPRFAMLRKRIKSFAMQGDGTLAGCLGLAALETLDYKISEMNHNVILAASFLDPLIKAQLSEIAKEVPRWNFDEAIHSVKQLTERYAESTQNTLTDGSREIDFPVHVESPIENEITRYAITPIRNIDALEFWSRHTEDYPTLAKLAKEILCIQASSAPSAKAFTSLEMVVTDLENRLGAEKASDMITLRSLIKNNFVNSNTMK